MSQLTRTAFTLLLATAASILSHSANAACEIYKDERGLTRAGVWSSSGNELYTVKSSTGEPERFPLARLEGKEIVDADHPSQVLALIVGGCVAMSVTGDSNAIAHSCWAGEKDRVYRGDKAIELLALGWDCSKEQLLLGAAALRLRQAL
jgi:hypothetical protein